MSSTLKINKTSRFAVLDAAGGEYINQYNIVFIFNTLERSLFVFIAFTVSQSNSKVSPSPAIAAKKTSSVTSSVLPNDTNENYYKSTLTLEERVAIAMSVGEEVITAEELENLFKGKFYDTNMVVRVS